MLLPIITLVFAIVLNALAIISYKKDGVNFRNRLNAQMRLHAREKIFFGHYF